MFDTLTRMGSSGAVAYDIDRSLKFEGGSSSYLTRTPGSDGNLREWTFSCWVKRTNIGVLQTFFSAGSNNPDTIIKFDADDRFEISRFYNVTGGYTNQVTSKAQFRDPSTWYHVVGAVDTTQGTASNRVKMYVNGEQITVFENDDYPDQNFDYEINDASYAHYIGRHPGGQYTSGYIAEFNFIDGQQLTASDFGKTDAATGQWIPIEYTGSYGSQGFYLNFSDNSGATSSTMGDDDSGNGNDWTPNNLATYDSVPDSPTNNFATILPIDTKMINMTLTEGGLKFDSGSNSNTGRGHSTIRPTSGKWYAEVWVGQHNRFSIGIDNKYYNHASNTGGANNPNGILVGPDSEAYYNGNTGNNYLGADIGSNDIVMIAMDCDNKLVWVGLDGTWGQSVSNTDIANGTATDSLGDFMSVTASTLFQGDMGIFIEDNSQSNKLWCWVNFGQDQGFGPSLSDASVALGNESDSSGYGKFKYPVPAGFNALCTKNLAAPTIKKPTDHFNNILYTGNDGTDRVISGVGFSPDLVWLKNRDGNGRPCIFDTQRLDSGEATLVIRSDLTNGDDDKTDRFGGMESDGFTVTGSDNDTNEDGDAYVAWNWGGCGSASSDTNGTITSSVMVNATAGFSIVTYTGDGAAGNSTVGHGLGVAPEMVIIKRRDDNGDWIVGHDGLADNAFTNNKFLKLHTTDDTFDNSLVWGAQPTSTVVQITTGSTATNLNGSGATYVMYCFSSVAGFSKVGSYKGNGNSNGNFIHTGFKPAWIMIKSVEDGEAWEIFDNARNPYNVVTERLRANIQNAEVNSTFMDFVSNGVKLRNTSGGYNSSDDLFVYLCFAESPFQYTSGH